MSKIIGVVPAAYLGDMTKSTASDYFRVGQNYAKRVLEAGGIPMALVPVDYWLTEESLDLCDGFIVQGGAEFYHYHFQVIHHAVTKGKRYLGICLGEQLIYAYFEIRRRVEERGYTGDLLKAICAYREEKGPDFSVLEPVADHYGGVMPRGNEDVVKHDVTIIPGSLLHRTLGRDKMRIASFHKLNVPPTQTLLPINAWSAKGDCVVEGVEYGENILGVQGHPEVDDLMPEFFNFLVEEKR